MKKIYAILAIMFSLGAWSPWAAAQCDGDSLCTITIAGTDQYGDGWNGAAITIYQNDAVVGSYSCSGASSSQSFSVCAGPVSFGWTQGNYDSECGFTITDSLGIVLYSHNSGSGPGSGIFCTDVACATCLRPGGLEVTDVTVEGATATWLANPDALGYSWQCNPSAMATAGWTQTADTTVALTGLVPNTLYYFRVLARCTATDSSSYATATFRTPCGDTPPPISTGFEENGTNMPFCWTLWEHTAYTEWGYTQYYPQIYEYYYYAHSGTRSLYLYDAYGPNSIISPKVCLPANQVEVNFWVRKDDNGSGAYLQVGYTNSNDSATAVFHMVAEVAISAGINLYTVDFGDLAITDSVYVVIRSAGNNVVTQYNDLYVDDITIRAINTCPLPTQLRLVSTDSGQVTLQWADSAGTQWQIAYGPVGFDPDYASSYVSAGSNPYTVTGLSNATAYDFYVRTVCGTQYGYWSQPATAQPWVYDMPSSGSDTIYVCGTSIADPGGAVGSFDENVVSDLVVYAADSVSGVHLSGSYNLNGAYLYVYEGAGLTGRLLATLTGMGTVTDLASTIGPLTLHLSTSWYSGDGFLFATSCQPLSSCTAPYDVAVSNITGTAALVSWGYGTFSTPAYFDIRVVDTADGGSELLFTAPDTARSYMVSGLQERTDYEVYVQSVCDNGDTSGWVGATFVTACISGGDIAIGEGTSTTYYMPTYSYYSSVSQQIFEAEYFEGVDSIFSIKINNSYAGSPQQVAVYLDTADINTYSSLSDFRCTDTAHKVFSGTLANTEGWNEIVFDSAFLYHGGKNLLLTFVNLSPSYNTEPSYYIHTTTGNKAVYAYNYSGTIDPTDSTTLLNIDSYSQGVLNTRMNIIFSTPCGDTRCVAPSTVVTALTDSSVSLSWVPGMDETEWQIEYRPADSTEWQLHTASTSMDTAYICGLMPTTTYRIRISSLCGDTTAGTILTVTTKCPGITGFPFVEDFEAFSASDDIDDMQPCWRRHTNSSYSTTYFYPYLDTWGNAHSGAGCLYFMSGWGDECTLVLPEMGVPLDTLTVEFDMMGSYTEYYYYTLYVGVMDDPANPATFHPLDTVDFTGADYEYQHFEVNLNNYSGTAHHIALRSSQGDDNGGFYLDDIKVDYFNPCLRPQQAAASNVTLNSATITFADPNNAGSYTLLYGTAADMALAADTISFTTTSVTLASLAPATEYHAWLRTNCPGMAGSAWTEVPAFRTLCNPYVVDEQNSYESNFEEGLDSCSSQYRIAGSTNWAAATSTEHPIGAHSGGHIASLERYNASDTAMYILPAFDFSDLPQGAELTFWLALSTYGSNFHDKLFVYTRTQDTADWTLLDSVTRTLDQWAEQCFLLPNSTNRPFYQVVFCGVTGGYGVKIDDISVHATPNCRRPVDFEAMAVTDSSATLAWDGDADRYQVHYRRLGALSWSSAMTTSTSIDITGLPNNTAFEARVRAVCAGDGPSAWSPLIHFGTEVCGAAQFYANYDSAGYDPQVTDNAPGDAYGYYSYAEILFDSARLAGLTDISAFSFHHLTTGTTNYFQNCDIYIGHTPDTVFGNFLYDSTFVHVYHGPFDFAGEGWCTLLFDTLFSWNGHDNIVVGINRSSDDYDYMGATSFQGHYTGSYKTISAYSTGMPISPATACNLPAYSRTLDVVSPDCRLIYCAPVCPTPVITSVTPSANSAIVRTNAAGSLIEYCYRASGGSWSMPVEIAAATFTLSGLSHSTAYEVRVRQNCGDNGGYSAWTSTSFVTDYICSVPADVVVSDITDTRALVTWTPQPNDHRWEVRVHGEGVNTTFPASEPSLVIEGLLVNKTYDVAVRTLCGPGMDVEGEYSDPVSFVTRICGAVGNASIEAIGNIVHLSWAPTSNASGYYEVQWGRAGYAPSEILGTVITPDTEAYVLNLVPHFDYGFRVRSLCGLEWNSDWSSQEFTITTGDRTAIDDVAGTDCLIVRPNPAFSGSSVSLTGISGHAVIQLIDINGRLLSSETVDTDAATPHLLSLADLPQGSYFIRVATSGSCSIRKLIVK